MRDPAPPRQIFGFVMIDRILAPGTGRILDLGCGTKWLKPRAERAGYTWFGLDVASSGKPDPAFVVGDAHSLPFKDGTFSAVVTSLVLAHLKRPHEALKEAWRVLEEGGCIYGSSAFIEGFQDLASYSHFSRLGLRELLEETGFTVTRMEPGVSGLYLLLRVFFSQPVADVLRPMLRLMTWCRKRGLSWYRALRHGRARTRELMVDYDEKTAFQFAGHILWVARK